LNDVLDGVELTDGWLLNITTDNSSSNYSMTHELRSTNDACGIEWPALCYHRPCGPHGTQLAVGELMSSFGVKGCTKSWEDHERDEQFGENESIDIGKSQTLRKVCNAAINQVSAMRLGLAKLIEKVHIA
jgi:hypothetical protein